VSRPARDELDVRLEALSARIADTLDRSRAWVEPLARQGDKSAEIEQLTASLHAAESSANLQAQRSAALEDRIVELETALIGARDQRARAEALAEAARSEADRALDELEQERGQSSERSRPFDMNVGEALQAKLLEIERLTRERDHLRRTCDELRTQTRELRRERDESTLALARTTSQLEELRERDIASRSKLAELERIVAEQRREIELAARRAKHMREHLGTSAGGGKS
jgi:septal ring factor EnvC (AmiA/AmiB activator)